MVVLNCYKVGIDIDTINYPRQFWVKLFYKVIQDVDFGPNYGITNW